MNYREIFDALAEQAWSVTRTANNHYRATPPDRTKPIVHFSTSEEPRAIRNTIKRLERSGFSWTTRAA